MPDIGLVEDDLPASDFLETLDQLRHGALASSALADDGQGGSALDGQTQLVEHQFGGFGRLVKLYFIECDFAFVDRVRLSWFG